MLNRILNQFPVHKIRHLFTVKAYVVPVAGIAFFVSRSVFIRSGTFLCKVDLGYCQSARYRADRTSKEHASWQRAWMGNG